jgi:hypothetical protein
VASRIGGDVGNDEAERSLKISAPPGSGWSVQGDVPRMPAWSEDLERLELLAGDGRSTGSRFRGDNRSGSRAWSMTCVIDRYEPDRLLEFHTEDKAGKPRTGWWYRLAPEDGGDATVVTEGFRRLTTPGLVRRLAERKLIGDRAEYNARNIDASLRRLAASIASDAARS